MSSSPSHSLAHFLHTLSPSHFISAGPLGYRLMRSYLFVLPFLFSSTGKLDVTLTCVWTWHWLAEALSCLRTGESTRHMNNALATALPHHLRHQTCDKKSMWTSCSIALWQGIPAISREFNHTKRHQTFKTNKTTRTQTNKSVWQTDKNPFAHKYKTI